MKPTKIYCAECSKFRKFFNPRISYIFDKTLVLSIIFKKCGNTDEIIFTEEKGIEILILDLIDKSFMYI